MEIKRPYLQYLTVAFFFSEKMGNRFRPVLAANPLIARFDIRSLDRSPCDSMCCLFLARVVRMRSKCVVECLPIDVLRMWRQVPPDREAGSRACRLIAASRRTKMYLIQRGFARGYDRALLYVKAR